MILKYGNLIRQLRLQADDVIWKLVGGVLIGCIFYQRKDIENITVILEVVNFSMTIISMLVRLAEPSRNMEYIILR